MSSSNSKPSRFPFIFKTKVWVYTGPAAWHFVTFERLTMTSIRRAVLMLVCFLLGSSASLRADSGWQLLDVDSNTPVRSKTVEELLNVLCSDEGASFLEDDGVLQQMNPCKHQDHGASGWNSWISLDKTGLNGLGALPISSRRGRRLYFTKSNGVWKIIGKAPSSPGDGVCKVIPLEDAHPVMACLDGDGGQGYEGYWVTVFDGRRVVDVASSRLYGNEMDGSRLLTSNEGGASLVNGYCYSIVPDAIKVLGSIESYAVQLRLRGRRQKVASSAAVGSCGGVVDSPELPNSPIESATWVVSGAVKTGTFGFEEGYRTIMDRANSFLGDGQQQ